MGHREDIFQGEVGGRQKAGRRCAGGGREMVSPLCSIRFRASMEGFLPLHGGICSAPALELVQKLIFKRGLCGRRGQMFPL